MIMKWMKSYQKQNKDEGHTKASWGCWWR
jgi:hypothetical protein